MRCVSSRTPYWTALNHLPDMAAFAPWVRCPPASSDRPMMVSPGLVSANMTAPLACAPEWGCTLTKLQLKSCLARRSEEHTSELQSLMRISYAVFCLKNKKQQNTETNHTKYATEQAPLEYATNKVQIQNS